MNDYSHDQEILKEQNVSVVLPEDSQFFLRPNADKSNDDKKNGEQENIKEHQISHSLEVKSPNIHNTELLVAGERTTDLKRYILLDERLSQEIKSSTSSKIDYDDRPSSSKTFTFETPSNWRLNSILQYSDDAGESLDSLPTENKQLESAQIVSKSVSAFIEKEIETVSKILEKKKGNVEKRDTAKKSRIPVLVQRATTRNVPQPKVSIVKSLSIEPPPPTAVQRKVRSSGPPKTVSNNNLQIRGDYCSQKFKKMKSVNEWLKSVRIVKDTDNNEIELIRTSATDLFLHQQTPKTCHAYEGACKFMSKNSMESGNLPMKDIVKYPDWVSIANIEEGLHFDQSVNSSVVSKILSGEEAADPLNSIDSTMKYPPDFAENEKKPYIILQSNVGWSFSDDGDISTSDNVPGTWVPSVLEEAGKYKCRQAENHKTIESDDNDDCICIDIALDYIPPEPEYLLPGQVERDIKLNFPEIEAEDSDDSAGPFSEPYEIEDVTWNYIPWTDSKSSVILSQPEMEPTRFKGEPLYLEDLEETTVEQEARTLFEQMQQYKAAEERLTSSSATSKNSKNRNLRELAWGCGSDPDRAQTSSDSCISSTTSLPKKPPPPDPSQFFDVKITENYLTFGKSCTSQKKEKTSFLKSLMKLFTNTKKK